MSTLEVLLDELESLMELQATGLEDYQVTQIRMKESLMAKNWPELERALHALEFKSNGLSHVESRRHDLWQKVRHLVLPEQHADFPQVLSRLPVEWRDRIGGLHRQIKVAALRLKGTTSGLDSYVQTAGTLLKTVIGGINPAFKGNLYGRRGQVRRQEPTSLVLNQSL